MAKLMEKIDVLDNGYVRLIDYMGDDLNIVRAARVSYDAAWRAGEDDKGDAKLLRYLWKNGHTSPFEAVSITFEVKAPIFVLRQWHRHRTWSYNELSARYRELPEDYYIPKMEHIGKQSTSSKQARTIEAYVDEAERLNNANMLDGVQNHMMKCFSLYRSLLQCGWPRELARTVLPLATYSHMFATVNLLNLFKFVKLRSHEHAQYEIRVYSDAMLELAKLVAPVSVQVFQEV